MTNSNHSTIRSILVGLLLLLPAATMAAPVNETFDHFTTGFPLTGGHRAVECDACHTSGQFRGTPRECASCHSLLMNTGAVVKSTAHIQTSNDCETCHSTLAWDDVRRVNHMAVLGDCKSCHYLGSTSGGPPNDASHAANTQDCITCHRTSTWLSVHYDHSAAGTQCNTCHSLTPTSGIAAFPPPINTMHNAATSNGLDCDNCHTTHSWSFSHSGTAGMCSTCHKNAAFNGVITQQPTSDFHSTAPNVECDACHSTRAWTPAGWDHSSASYYPDHTFRTIPCSDCHGTSGNYSISWLYPTPDCYTCHQSDFSKEHSSSKLPDYHNCTVGCHEHSDALSRGKW